MHFSIINGFATRMYMQICFLAAARWGAISSVKRTDTHTHAHTYKKTRFLPFSTTKWERSRGLCADAKSQRVPSALFKSAQVRVSDALQLSHTLAHSRTHANTLTHSSRHQARPPKRMQLPFEKLQKRFTAQMIENLFYVGLQREHTTHDATTR